MSLLLKRVALAAIAVTGVALAGCSSGSSGGGFVSSASTAATTSTSPGSTTGSAYTPSALQPIAPAPSTPIPTYGSRRCWPIVLVHGIAGFRNIGPLAYWFDIQQELERRGFEVYVCQDTPFASIEDRAKQVRDQIQQRYPDKRVKVNLIAHSMGGLDCRYLISRGGLAFGDRVASATTIGTPHHGTTVSDVCFALVPGPVMDATNLLFNVFGWDIKASKELSTWYCNTVFNPATPDDPNVPYFSYAGHADPTGSQTGVVLGPYFIPTWAVLKGVEGENDGLISVQSAKWGTFRGILPCDHIGEVNQPIGLTKFDAVKFYGDLGDELEARHYGP